MEDRILEHDHSLLSELLIDLQSRLQQREAARAFELLDLSWARLAVHIRAENLCLFPAILNAPRELFGTNGGVPSFEEAKAAVEGLRSDHNFFMDELSRAVKTFREIMAKDETSHHAEQLATIRERAFELWRPGHAESQAGMLNDPGYEAESDLQEPGFGWRIADEESKKFRLSLDNAGPRQGRTSLKVDFDGDSNPALPIISQLVLVEPHTRYRLSFSARTEGLIGGGLPSLVVVDAGSNNALAQSDELPQATNGWRDYAFDFSSGESATAIQINLQRQICPQLPCPIFGQLWLDNLWLQKL